MHKSHRSKGFYVTTWIFYLVDEKTGHFAQQEMHNATVTKGHTGVAIGWTGC